MLHDLCLDRRPPRFLIGPLARQADEDGQLRPKRSAEPGRVREKPQFVRASGRVGVSLRDCRDAVIHHRLHRLLTFRPRPADPLQEGSEFVIDVGTARATEARKSCDLGKRTAAFEGSDGKIGNVLRSDGVEHPFGWWQNQLVEHLGSIAPSRAPSLNTSQLGQRNEMLNGELHRVSFELVVAFDTDSRDFARGFEIGRLWAKLEVGDAVENEYVHACNAEMLLRVSEARGIRLSADFVDEDWLSVTFVQDREGND